MGKITSINLKRATIEFPNFCIRLFVKYQGVYCSEIRLWKLPPGGSFWYMFNTKNLDWAIYGDAAKKTHGWFTPSSVTAPNDNQHWLKVFGDGIADCKDYDEIKNLLINIEGMLVGDASAITKLSFMLSRDNG